MNFNYLSNLYKEDPEAFEAEKRRILEDFIASLPTEDARRRARGLQFKIDAQLTNIKDPVAKMNKMVELFWEGFKEFHDVLTNPLNVIAKKQDGSGRADVIPITRKQKK